MRKITRRILSSIMAAVLIVGTVPCSVSISENTVQAATDLTLYEDDYIVDLEIIKSSELLRALNEIIPADGEKLTFGMLKEYTGDIDLSDYPDINTVEGLGYAISASSIDLSALTKVSVIYDSEFRKCAFTEFKLPPAITEIEAKAFLGCSNLETIEFPDTLKKIGGQAFESCSALNDIEFPNRLEKLGDESFANCKSLTEIVIPDNINAALEGADSEALSGIGASVFNGCTSLESIKFGAAMTIIPAGFLQNTESLQSVTIPEKITDIRSSAFAGSAISEIDLSKNTNLTVINSMTFSGCAYLSEVYLPSGITCIETNAFQSCVSLKNTDFIAGLKSLVSIESYAFANSGISDAHIPGNVETIGLYSFSNCDNLVKVTIDDFTYNPTKKITKQIGNYAFSQCTLLEEVVLPEKNQNNELVDIEIGNYAFYLCTRLEKINYPLNISRIGNYAFFKASKTVTDWEKDDEYEGEHRGRSGYINMDKVYTKQQEGTEPFLICTNDVNYPEYYQPTVVYIDPNYVFEETLYESYNDDRDRFNSNYSYYPSIVEQYRNITSFETYVYYEPLDVKYVDARKIYNKITVLSTEVADFDSRSTVYVSSYYIHETKQEGDALFLQYEGNTVVDMLYINPAYVYRKFSYAGRTVYPEESAVRCEELYGDDKQHTAYVFYGNIYDERQSSYDYECKVSGINKIHTQIVAGQKEIDLSKNINMEIGEGAFAEVYSLQKAILPEDMTSVPKKLFNGCSYAIKAGIGGATIKNYEQAEDKWYGGLETVIMSNTVVEIMDAVFENCYALVMNDTVKLPNKLVYIGGSAFKNCESLNKITFPSTLEYVGSAAFQGTSRLIGGFVISERGLTELDVTGASSLAYIGSNAFNQSAFKHFDMNEAAPVTKIFGGTFTRCENLERVMLSPSVKYVAASSMNLCYRLESLHVPDTCVLDYEMCKGSTRVASPGSFDYYTVENTNGNTYIYICTKRFVLSVDIQNPKVAVRENGVVELPLSNVDADGSSFYKLIKIGDDSSYSYNSVTGELVEDVASGYVVPVFSHSAKVTVPGNDYVGASNVYKTGINLNGISEVSDLKLVVEEELKFVIDSTNNVAISATPNAQYSIDVTKNPCESIKCDDRVYVELNGTKTLAPEFVPQYADSHITDKVKWSVESGADLISVTPSKDGLSAVITPTKAGYGTASIRVTAGEVTKIVYVNISVPASKITLSKSSMELSVGAKSEELRATLSYSSANQQYAELYGDNVKYASSDESIIRLETATDENGVNYCKVIAVGYGKATITATSTTKDSVKATCSVYVVAADVGMTVKDSSGKVLDDSLNLELINNEAATFTYSIDSELKLDNLSCSINDDIVDFSFNASKKTFTLKGKKSGSTEVVVYPSAADPEQTGISFYVTVSADVKEVVLIRKDIVVGSVSNVFVSMTNVFDEVIDTASKDSFESITDNKVVFTSSNTSVATVDGYGNVKALKYSSSSSVVAITCTAYRDDEAVAIQTTYVYIAEEGAEIESTTPPIKDNPIKPTGVTCVSEARGSITIDANNPGNGQQYIVYIDGYEWDIVLSLPVVIAGVDPGVRAVSISGFLNGKESELSEQINVNVLAEDPTEESTADVTTEPETTTQKPTSEAVTAKPTTQPTTQQLATTKQNVTTAKPTTQQVATTKQNVTTTTQPTTATINVTVARAKVKKAVRAKNNKKIKLTLNKISNASGYEISYSTNKKFKKKFTKTVNVKKPTKTIKKLKSNKKYYVKARAYVIVAGKKQYGKWSKVKTVKVKK